MMNRRRFMVITAAVLYLLVGVPLGLIVAGTTRATPWRKAGLFLFFALGWGPFLAYALLF